jgi:phosphate:Na+ symporter
MAIMGIGMVFFGLELMKNGFKPLRYMPEFEAWFKAFRATTYLGIIKCALVGCVLTMIGQSSSATLGITIGLASTGVIEFQTAAALVMGENIGTTITAWLASLGTTTAAKRAAYAHVFFNVLGTCWFIALFPFAVKALAQLINWKTGYNPVTINLAQVAADLYPHLPSESILADIAQHTDPLTREGIAAQNTFEQIVTAGIALTHTAFNVANVLIFLPFAGALSRLVTRLVPEKAVKEIQHLAYLDVRMLDTPSLGIVQSQRQINFMGESAIKMLHNLRICLENDKPDAERERKIFHREEILDNVQKEIFLYLSRLVAGQVPHEVSERAHMQMRVADEYESISDYAVDVLKGLKKLEKNSLALDPSARAKLLELHDRVFGYIKKVNEYVKTDNKDIMAWAGAESLCISKLMKGFRGQHLERLQNEEVSPFFSLIFTDMLNFYRRMKDHALNIAEVIAGEK